MKTLEDAKAYAATSARSAAANNPLTIGGTNVCALAAENPTAAYDLVFNAVRERGGLKAFHAHRERQSCIQAAMAKPLPGAAGEAFTLGLMTVNGRTIYRVVPTHFRCLQAVDSPMLKLYQRAVQKPGEKLAQDFTEKAEWEVCYIFTTPPRQLRLLLDSGGAEAVRKAAQDLCECVDETHPGWSASEINMTVMSAVAQMNRHAKTTVAFEAEAESSGTTFFHELREHLKQAESEKSSAT